MELDYYEDPFAVESNQYANKFDEAFDLENWDATKLLIKECEDLIKLHPDDYKYAPLYYSLGTSYSDLMEHIPEYVEDSIQEKVVYYFRSCFELLSNEKLDDPHYKPYVTGLMLPLLTNYANTMDRNFNILHQQYIEPTIVWEDSKLDSAKQKIEAMQKQLPQLLVKCGGAFALTHWSKREDYPDLLGFCYNHICEALISSIEENDFETFKGAYSGFLAIMLLYQEYIRTDVIKIKEPHRQQGVFHVATAPIIEYAMISGFAILWGEFNHSPQWGELITTELQRFIKEDEDNHSVTLKRITEMATARKHHMFGIGNRDVLQTGWKQRIERAIRNSGLCEYEYKSFGQKVLKTDSKLLKIFCGISFSDMGFTYDVEDIYFICCVNPYMPPESRYIGDFKWEEDLDED